jgi:long-subunit fatty acid transport protein
VPLTTKSIVVGDLVAADACSGRGSSGDLFDKATLIPSFYAAYGLTNSLSFGLAVNSPFGLKTVLPEPTA